MNQNSRNSQIYLLLVIGVISAFGPFVTDFYLPALPALKDYFSTTASVVQLTLTLSMIGLATGQLFIGPLSDKYGRKRPLITSILLFIVSTVACLFAKNIEWFIFFRLIQGVAGAGGVVIGKSIATDLYEGNALARFFSMLSSVQGLAPIAAPVLGGLLLEVTDWRGIFVILLILGILLLMVLFRFRESLPQGKRSKQSVMGTFKHYLPVLRHRQFMLLVGAQGFAMGTMFAYISASPFIFQQHYGLSPVMYSLCFGINAVGIMLGNLIVIRYKSIESALQIGATGFLLFSVIVSTALLLSLPLLLLEIALFILLFFLGMILSTTTTLALDLERQNSGNAAAILGFIVFAFGGLVSPLPGIGNMLISTSGIIVACCFCAWICVRIRR